MAYCTPIEVAKQLGKPALANDPVDSKLQNACDAAEYQINRYCGLSTSLDPVPPTINMVAISAAVDLYKLADATFGVIGAGETGMVTVPRDFMNRYDAMLIGYYDPVNGWGVA